VMLWSTSARCSLFSTATSHVSGRFMISSAVGRRDRFTAGASPAALEVLRPRAHVAR
jgi:hypothetical protein